MEYKSRFPAALTIKTNFDDMRRYRNENLLYGTQQLKEREEQVTFISKFLNFVKGTTHYTYQSLKNLIYPSSNTDIEKIDVSTEIKNIGNLNELNKSIEVTKMRVLVRKDAANIEISKGINCDEENKALLLGTLSQDRDQMLNFIKGKSYEHKKIQGDFSRPSKIHPSKEPMNSSISEENSNFLKKKIQKTSKNQDRIQNFKDNLKESAFNPTRVNLLFQLAQLQSLSIIKYNSETDSEDNIEGSFIRKKFISDQRTPINKKKPITIDLKNKILINPFLARPILIQNSRARKVSKAGEQFEVSSFEPDMKPKPWYDSSYISDAINDSKAETDSEESNLPESPIHKSSYKRYFVIQKDGSLPNSPKPEINTMKIETEIILNELDSEKNSENIINSQKNLTALANDPAQISDNSDDTQINQKQNLQTGEQFHEVHQINENETIPKNEPIQNDTVQENEVVPIPITSEDTLKVKVDNISSNHIPFQEVPESQPKYFTQPISTIFSKYEIKTQEPSPIAQSNPFLSIKSGSDNKLNLESFIKTSFIKPFDTKPLENQENKIGIEYKGNLQSLFGPKTDKAPSNNLFNSSSLVRDQHIIESNESSNNNPSQLFIARSNSNDAPPFNPNSNLFMGNNQAINSYGNMNADSGRKRKQKERAFN